MGSRGTYPGGCPRQTPYFAGSCAAYHPDVSLLQYNLCAVAGALFISGAHPGCPVAGSGAGCVAAAFSGACAVYLLAVSRNFGAAGAAGYLSRVAGAAGGIGVKLKMALNCEPCALSENTIDVA